VEVYAVSAPIYALEELFEAASWGTNPKDRTPRHPRPANEEMDVKLYALSTCPYCRMTKKYLDENSIEYALTEVDTLDGDEKQAAIDEVKKVSGGTSFPVLVVDEEVIVGFNKVRIKEALSL